MSIYSIAIVPSIVLLFFIYKKDKREKEPFGLLLGCFIFGVISVLPAVILETILGDYLLLPNFVEGSLPHAFLNGFVVAGFSEELSKYLLMKAKTWKNKNFDCSFDGIVYAVFVSLGFATLENILYVSDGGLSTALVRMVTSIPGHTCFAVYMGYFYSKAKIASVEGDTAAYRRNKRLAVIVPMIAHGLYDSLIMTEESVVGETISAIGVLVWLVYLVVLYIGTFIFVAKASKNDKYMMHTQTDMSFIYNASLDGLWSCPTCLTRTTHNFCSGCGRPRPLNDVWTCTHCGYVSALNYCGKCGKPRA